MLGVFERMERWWRDRGVGEWEEGGRGGYFHCLFCSVPFSECRPVERGWGGGWWLCLVGEASCAWASWRQAGGRIHSPTLYLYIMPFLHTHTHRHTYTLWHRLCSQFPACNPGRWSEKRHFLTLRKASLYHI